MHSDLGACVDAGPGSTASRCLTSSARGSDQGDIAAQFELVVDEKLQESVKMVAMFDVEERKKGSR